MRSLNTGPNKKFITQQTGQFTKYTLARIAINRDIVLALFPSGRTCWWDR